MFKRWLSSFWKRNKAKIFKFLKSSLLIIGGAYGVFMAITLFAKNTKTSENKIDEKLLVYKPTKTIASGKNISSTEFEEEKNLVEVFLDNCNKQNAEEAYNMLTRDCKEELYPTLEKFKKNYYDSIFTEQRKYNMQSWVNSGKYHTYLVRFVNDALSTGVYKKDNVYQDYITICEENNTKKISIGEFIKKEELDSVLDQDQIKIVITNKIEYMEYVEFTVSIKNSSSKTIKMDAYENLNGIKAQMSNDAEYAIDWNGFDMDNLVIKPGRTKNMRIRFNIPYGINSIPKKINFTNIVLDYDEYIKLNTFEERTKYDKKAKMVISLQFLMEVHKNEQVY